MDALIARTPLWVRKFVVDFVETSIGLLLALNLVVPGDMSVAKAQGLVIGAAILSGLVSAVRRAAPSFVTWFAAKMGTVALLSIVLVLAVGTPVMARHIKPALVAESIAVTGPLTFGSPVGFTYTSADTSTAFAELDCWANASTITDQPIGSLIEGGPGVAVAAIWWLPDATINLGPTPSWSGGGADCTAYLVHWTGFTEQETPNDPFGPPTAQADFVVTP